MKTFLLSSDNEIIETLQKYTKKSGDDLEIASNVDTAKEMIKSGDYDAVLMDCSIRASVLIGLAVDLYDILVETVVLLVGPLSREQRDQLGHRLRAGLGDYHGAVGCQEI